MRNGYSVFLTQEKHGQRLLNLKLICKNMIEWGLSIKKQS